MVFFPKLEVSLICANFQRLLNCQLCVLFQLFGKLVVFHYQFFHFQVQLFLLHLLLLQFFEVIYNLDLEFLHLAVLIFASVDIFQFFENSIDAFDIHPLAVLLFALVVDFLADLDDELVEFDQIVLLVQLALFLLNLRGSSDTCRISSACVAKILELIYIYLVRKR